MTQVSIKLDEKISGFVKENIPLIFTNYKVVFSLPPHQ